MSWTVSMRRIVDLGDSRPLVNVDGELESLAAEMRAAGRDRAVAAIECAMGELRDKDGIVGMEVHVDDGWPDTRKVVEINWTTKRMLVR
jgi:hypothetical protein